jgi:hypothetical protein
MSQAIPASMSKSAKVILIVGGTLAGTMILFAVIAALVLRVSLKSRVEAIASEALGMEVHVGGRLAIGFVPGAAPLRWTGYRLSL